MQRHDPDRAAPAVVPLPASDIGEAVDVLAAAFGGYPALRYIVGDAGPRFEGHLRTLLRFFCEARAVRGEPILGVRAGGRLAAVALASLPDAVAPPGALDARRASTWAALGAPARARYEELGRTWQGFALADPHVHLNLVGVLPAQQGAGFGRALVDGVQEISRAHPSSRGVTLTTEVAANVALYRRLGFTVVGEAEVGPSLRTWAMVRPDAPGAVAPAAART
jgi:ribosomal protein S18 acetylase RimI-like enzyme